ncbi:cell surface A33 antigen-like [Odontesthes bonariensis]|uniref:cell surface A33 antigen-like n=1 Tax=Odontesthes bonariensis TaxID=219752 RepID=UPI003F58FF80
MERWTSTVALLCVVWSGVAALVVTIPKPDYEFARGDNITLPCSFKSTQINPPAIIISWSVEAEEANAEETLILTHYYPAEITDIQSQYEGRVSVDLDIKTGKADLKLSSITIEDNKIFECRVQIPKDDEGTPVDTARLVVLVAPSPPICKIQGTTEYGENINLTCYSEEGSPPPTYKWDSQDVQRIPRIPDPRTTDKGGILSLYNISKDTSGYYVCTSRNKIRSAICNVTVTVMPPSMKIGSTAGIIAAVVAFLILLIVVIYCCCCRKKKKEEEEEYPMGKRVDEYHDKEPDRNGESRQGDGEESTRGYGDSRSPVDRRDQYEQRSERDYDRRSDYDDRRSDYDDRRSDYDDRRRDYDNRREKYSDRHERYDDDRRNDDDERRYNDRRDRRNEDDDRYDDRDRAPSAKPPRRDDDY